MTIRDGELDGFKQHVVEIMRQTREKDTKTLRYDWFLSDDGTRCEVREAYVDADALLEHHHHIADAKVELFRDFADDHDMTLYAAPSPALASALEGMADHVAFHRYSLFQGLDAEAPEESAQSTFEACARLKIRDGALEAFKQQVAEIVKKTRAEDTKPIRYDWFLSDDGTDCEVRETYVDADALLQQQRAIGEAKMRLFRECIAGHGMTFYGEPSPALAAALKAMSVDAARFSFFQGLDVDAQVPHELLA
jgi:quinol monooxygenase YgiN